MQNLEFAMVLGVCMSPFEGLNQQRNPTVHWWWLPPIQRDVDKNHPVKELEWQDHVSCLPETKCTGCQHIWWPEKERKVDLLLLWKLVSKSVQQWWPQDWTVRGWFESLFLLLGSVAKWHWLLGKYGMTTIPVQSWKYHPEKSPWSSLGLCEFYQHRKVVVDCPFGTCRQKGQCLAGGVSIPKSKNWQHLEVDLVELNWKIQLGHHWTVCPNLRQNYEQFANLRHGQLSHSLGPKL